MRPAFLDKAARRGSERTCRLDAIVATVACVLGFVGLYFAGLPQ